MPIADAKFSWRFFLCSWFIYSTFSLAHIPLKALGFVDGFGLQGAGPTGIYLGFAWPSTVSQISHLRPWALIAKQGSAFLL